MAVETIKSEKKPYVIHVNGMALFGIMSSITPNTEADAFDLETLNKVLFSGVHQVEMFPWVPAVRDHSDKVLSLTLAIEAAEAAEAAKTAEAAEAAPIDTVAEAS